MLWTALEDPDPVLIFEHQMLYNMEGELADDAGAVDIDRAAIRRTGQRRDARSPTAGRSARRSQAAETLAGEGIDAEVIDLRTLRPLDMDDDPGVGARRRSARGDRRRRLAQRQPVGRDQRAD